MEKEDIRRLARLRQRTRIDRTDLAARAEICREQDRAREERQRREENVKKVKKLVWQHLLAMDEDTWPVYEKVKEQNPDEYFVSGRAYTGALFHQWADFEITVNLQTGKVSDYKAKKREPVRLGRADIIARDEKVEQARKERVQKLVTQYLVKRAPDSLTCPVFEEIKGKTPGKTPEEYLVVGRAYTGALHTYWADFEIIFNINSEKILDYKVKRVEGEVAPVVRKERRASSRMGLKGEAEEKEKVEEIWVHTLVRQYLQTMAPDAWPILQEIKEKSPGEYFVSGRVYTGGGHAYGADFEITVDRNTGRVSDYKVKDVTPPQVAPRRYVRRFGEE